MSGRRIPDHERNRSLDACNLASNQIMAILTYAWIIDGPAQSHWGVSLFTHRLHLLLGESIQTNDTVHEEKLMKAWLE